MMTGGLLNCGSGMIFIFLHFGEGKSERKKENKAMVRQNASKIRIGACTEEMQCNVRV